MRVMKASRFVFLFLVLVLVDQVSKLLAWHFFQEEINIFTDFSFYFTKNFGIAFSIDIPLWVTIVFTSLLLVGLGWIILKKKDQSLSEKAVFVFLLSGGMGNLIDRLLWGGVTDFLSFWSFPVFNFADVFITSGIVIFLWVEVFKKRKKID